MASISRVQKDLEDEEYKNKGTTEYVEKVHVHPELTSKDTLSLFKTIRNMKTKKRIKSITN